MKRAFTKYPSSYIQASRTIKFTKIYIGSGTSQKDDYTDYVEYYLADNGMVIEPHQSDLGNSSQYRSYHIYNSVDDYRAKGVYPLARFDTLRAAKQYIIDNYT